ncbi:MULTISPECIES: phosphatase PAP2 family protein [Pseudomonas]|jgi:membrane-associated phospholipid phosphatase|uniref:Phosphatase PAP2 family protein n=1 Tax=Pseudomonas lundensis TaxID=86185 RepID=A0ABX4GLZ4_9PSED|nr:MULTISPECIES: phosphatase PAP2 family protein [Pseudomonas]AOZ13248.1 phosphoesterase [Pseudomonas lundensis]MBM1180708.1 phosphatase PAP2 family protein [Pseudomonas lundensis]MBS5840586.1 phosphatase PAP2 family protein [Pseudomonas sp.]MCT8953914.1 phosphatase PAP2 family protein [Pseudomonas lundensis]NMZ55194.1 phosphatase PAP2 family protein [Pseudomonas lundensis]
MNNPTLFQTRWNLRALAGCNLLALGLLCFWLWPFGQILCLTFDDWLFHLLNRPLADNPIWLHMWAVASLRPFDVVVGVIMLALLIKGNWVFEATQVRRALFGFLAILLLLVVIRALFSKLTAAMGWQHNSPSMVFEDAIHLSDFFPGLEKTWELKDRSSQSFPGDHASVLLIWGMFMSVFSRTIGQKVVIWGLTLLFMMPRLVAGAHWGQDDYIGGLLLAFLALGWGYYTPFAAKVSGALMRVTAPIFSLLQRLPLVSRMSVVRG